MNNNNNGNNVYYYGNNDFLDKYKNSTAVPDKKKKGFNFFAILIFLLSIYCFYKNLSYFALAGCIFCFIFSIFNLKSRNVFYYVAGFVSFAAIVMFALFYLGFVENSSEALLTIKKDRFVNDVQNATTKVLEDYRILSHTDKQCYNFKKINSLFTLKLGRSSFGSNYSQNSYILIDNNKISVCFVDEKGNGFYNVSDADLNRDNLQAGIAFDCMLPSYCK